MELECGGREVRLSHKLQPAQGHKQNLLNGFHLLIDFHPLYAGRPVMAGAGF